MNERLEENVSWFGRWWPMVFLGFAAFLVFAILATLTAEGKEFSGASDAEWYASLMQPDTPPSIPYPQSCCGAADAYYADEQEIDPVDGGIIAIITDTRPDQRPVSTGVDGSYIFVNRPHIAPGTKIKVPASKLRKVPSFNPTDHTIIFVSNSGYVYCYEPATLM